MPEPQSLLGSLARIARAEELLHDLAADLSAFVETRPYVLVEVPDPDPTARAFVVREVHSVPERPRIIAGEVAHHLRVAFDLLAYQLLLKGGVSDPGRLKKCAFPIITDLDLSNAEDKKKHDRSIKTKISGAPQAAYDRIVALQPCATNGECSHLAQIQALDNTDKHRLLLAATASVKVSGWNFRDESGNVTTVPHHSFVPLHVDALLKVAPAPPGFVIPNLARGVAFTEPGPVFGRPVEAVLRNLARTTRETVRIFSDCF